MDLGQADGELSKRLRLGDERAFTLIYQQHWQSLFNSAFKRLNDKEQARDIVQTVFADLWRRRDELVIQNVQAYLHKAVRFQVFTHISKRPHLTPLLEEFDSLLSGYVNADHQTVDKDVLHLVNLCINALPPKRRAIFLMYTHEELPSRIIAEKMGISRKTVQNQVNNALIDIRLMISKVLTLALIGFLNN